MNELVKKELNELALADEWLERKEKYETAKYEFDVVDKPFKKWLKDKMFEYGIDRIFNNYLDATKRKGYMRATWNDKAVEEYIKSHGDDPDNYRTFKHVDESIAIKYKE